MSPFRVVIVDDAAAREVLAGAMLGANGDRVRSAPATAVFAADLQATRSVDDVVAMEARAGKPSQYLRALPLNARVFASDACVAPGGAAGLGGPPLPGALSLLRGALTSVASHVAPSPTPNSAEGWAFKNASLAAMTFMLGAAAAGLGSSPMEGFDARRVRAALGIPDRFAVPLMVAVGYEAAAVVPAAAAGGGGEAAAPRRSLRMPPATVFRRNTFNTPLEGVPELV